jgi:transcriptional regulator with XRE-family HTH domain
MNRNPLLSHVGLAIRHHRQALKISQNYVAEKLGMHRTYYSAIERGRKNMQLDTLDRMCRVLDVSMRQIMQELKNGTQHGDACVGMAGRPVIGETASLQEMQPRAATPRIHSDSYLSRVT